MVGAGNYTYYTLEAPDMQKSIVITVSLQSLEGDADLYISGHNKKPTFDVEGHSFQSTSCGNEIVVVPSHFVREESPVVIGVYGTSDVRVESRCGFISVKSDIFLTHRSPPFQRFEILFAGCVGA